MDSVSCYISVRSNWRTDQIRISSGRESPIIWMFNGRSATSRLVGMNDLCNAKGASEDLDGYVPVESREYGRALEGTYHNKRSAENHQ